MYNYLQLLLTLILVGTVFVSTFAQPTNIIADTLKESSVPTFSECGGVLNGQVSAITYKSDSPILPNERCVWTIRSPSALTYSLEVLGFWLQVSPGETGVTATCLSPANISDVAINGTGLVNLPSTCRVLVITSYAGGNVSDSRGFIMMYQATAGTSDISTSSKYYIMSSGGFRYPLSVESNYTHKELSTFVFPPQTNIYDILKTTLVTYVADSLEGLGCSDFLQLYRFRPASGWTNSTAVCGNVEFTQWTDSDIMLVVFKSDNTVVGRGFHFILNNLPF